MFLWGYAKLYRIENRPEYLEKIRYLLVLLNSLKSSGYSGHCWGYNFDWQSRAFFLPKYTPTVVNSSFIGHALLDAYEHTGIKEALELAIPVKDFILNDLHRYEENGAICFSYSPIDHYFVHNANLLGASFLIRISKFTEEKNLKDTALASLAYAINHQREDGSWFYAEKEGAHWIDSFHTGFNLQALKYFLDIGHGEEYRPQFNKGVKFYADHFFLEDGTPKYFHNRVYPIDIHCPTQAVVFFSQMGPDYRMLTEKVLAWLIENMQDREGYFYFQKTKFYTNKVPYMRWSQAWAFHALTEYYLTQRLNLI
ncbi:MAG: delta-aminolevulinic acid dehydratase [Deltaproteobacteria bacterium]|nr:delta-aminolevulinic acid dehydratase [Deltaproteobacteria bacterium]